MEYVSIHKREGHGPIGGFGIEILVAADKLPDLKQKSIAYAVYDAVDKVSAEINAAIKADHPQTVDEITKNKELVNLFKCPIFVEEIPNGYCDDWCCRHLPWFTITTSIGRFKIGWRKRVINIDWSETVSTGNSSDLFKDEDVTKGHKSIHAWSMEKAKQYLAIIINSAE